MTYEWIVVLCPFMIWAMVPFTMWRESRRAKEGGNVANREKSRKVKECQKFEVLKPCPFCGAKAMLVYCVHGVGANWGVECTETHAHRIEFSGTQDDVIREWNRRGENDV